MGWKKIKKKFKKFKKKLGLKKWDYAGIFLGIPPLDPRRPLTLLGRAMSPELEDPEAPPDFRFPGMDEKKAKIRRFGRGSTIATSPAGLSSGGPTILGQ